MKVLVVVLGLVHCLNCAQLKSYSYNENDDVDERALNWLLIFPGTKWCGAGSIAENDNDLGPEVEADRCCRAHDFCDDIIEARATKHGLKNKAVYTRLNCRCDVEFHNCLKDANTKTSNKVGFVYFNILGTKCFKDDYPARCVRYSSKPRQKCLEYAYDTSQSKRYQWFDVQDY